MAVTPARGNEKNFSLLEKQLAKLHFPAGYGIELWSARLTCTNLSIAHAHK